MNLVSPESVGVPSSAILAFLNDLRESRFNMHSVLVLRHGELIYEAYQAPYGKDVKHRLASVSKTFTAIAAGLLIDEGKLSLDDKVVKFFPEYTPEPVHPLLAAATIEDMLTMRDPHYSYSHGFSIKANWLESWFLTPPDHPAGTIFEYNTTSTNLVASIIERISGMDMMEYMYPRLLSHLGFSEGCFCGKTPDGDAFGGSAVHCTPRDLAKLALFVMNGGKWDGKQLMSEEFILRLRSNLVDNSLFGISVEGMFGYGYFTWHLRGGGFGFFGIHGQFAFGFPENGLVVVTTGNTTDHYANEGDILISQFSERIYNNLLPALSEKPLNENPVEHKKLLERDKLPFVLAPGKTSSLKSAMFSGASYAMHPNTSGWKNASFKFEGDKGKICYTNRRGSYEIEFGFGYAHPITFPEAPSMPAMIEDNFGYDSTASAGWINDTTLAIHIYPIRGGYMHINAVFNGDTLTIAIKPKEGFRADYGGYMYGNRK